jgi:hypothetical protein
MINLFHNQINDDDDVHYQDEFVFDRNTSIHLDNYSLLRLHIMQNLVRNNNVH